MALPKITVVTPSYNQAGFIEATMESLHGQGYPDLEHIVIDGASTDGTVEVLERYDDQIAYWVSEPDSGQTDALAKGFARATGDIQCWLNSDDLHAPGALREVAAHFGAHPETRFVYGNSQWIDVEGRFIKPKREHRWNRFVFLNDHNFIPQPSAFWRGDLFQEVGGLDPTFDLAMDADLWARFAEVTRPVHVPSLWSSMRFYPEQKNTRMREQSLAEMDRIRGRYQSAGSPWRNSLYGVAARASRITLKTLSGGYPVSELSRHLPRLLGRGTWEADEARTRRDPA